jgi:hypothetical protein
MTNITINTTCKNMDLHIQKAYEIIDDHLPFNYSNAIKNKLPKDGSITSGMIRNVKRKLNTRLDILNAMVEVALENKKLKESFKELTT